LKHSKKHKLKAWVTRILKRGFQIPREITVTEWSDQNRRLDPMSSAEPGVWRTERTPYLREPMDAFADPAVEDITIIASTQVGKTESMLNMLGYAIDEDPGPTLWVTARIEDIKTIALDRIKPMIDLSPTLCTHKTHYTDDISKSGIKLENMILYMAGSNSPAGLASRPIRYLFLDELDKYPKFSGKEADPLSLSTERTRTFWNRKIVKSSTPTTKDGVIHKEYQKTDKKRFHVPCPHCGVFQPLVFPQISWGEERDPEKVKEERLAFYECTACKGRIDDLHKPKMLSAGKWVPDGCQVEKDGTLTGEIPRTTRRGYWINCLYSPWLTWSDIAAKFLESREDIPKLMNFVNSWLAEIWEEKTEETKEDELRMLVQDVPEGIVPDEAILLTAGTDIQKDYMVYTIRAWGYNDESWLIRAGYAESWAQLETILFNTQYPRRTLSPLQIRLACIDTGYRTDEAYEFTRRHRDRARAIKGVDRLSGVPYTMSKIDRNPKTGAIMPGGVSLYRLDTFVYKDKLTRLITSDPSIFHLYKEPMDDYFKQMTAEHKVIRRDKKNGKVWEVWCLKTEALKNNFWDTEVYSAAAADMLFVSSLRKENQVVTYEPRAREASGFLNRESSGWLGKKEGWVRR
jgi:phage terminase large subunit GpA-like protein